MRAYYLVPKNSYFYVDPDEAIGNFSLKSHYFDNAATSIADDLRVMLYVEFNNDEFFKLDNFNDLVFFLKPKLNPPTNVLVVSTGKSCCSIFATELINNLSKNRFQAFSTGSEPIDKVNPVALDTLSRNGVQLSDSYQIQSWKAFSNIPVDIVVTVGDQIAQESYPAFLNKACCVHWNLSDPSKVTGSEEGIANAFQVAYAAITAQVKQTIPMLMQGMTADEIRRAFNRIAEME